MNLNDINPADAVDFTKLIQSNEELKAVRPLLAVGADLDWKALLEANGNVLGNRWRSDRIIGACDGQQPNAPRTKKRREYSPSPHVVRRWSRWVLQLSALVAAMRNVVIHAPRLGLG